MSDVLFIEILGNSPLHGDHNLHPFPVGVGLMLKESSLTISSSPSSFPSLVLADSTITRQHARVFWTSDGWRIRDLGSDNGTWLAENDTMTRLTAWEDTEIHGSMVFVFGYVLVRFTVSG